MRAGDCSDGVEEFAEKFGSIIRANDVGRPATKVELIEQTRYEVRGLRVVTLRSGRGVRRTVLVKL